MLNISKIKLDDFEIEFVKDVLKSGFLSQDKKVEELEYKFAKYIGTKYAVAVSSGTAALHLALIANGIKENNEVITTSLSFIATANSILMVDAIPRFVDININDYNINSDLIEYNINKRTKAIIPVHLYGQPCEMSTIMKIARRYKLKVIEDACQSVGAVYNNKKVGSFGNCGCFSLYGTKNLAVGEGGLITTNNKVIYETCKSLRQHGQPSYKKLGYNYRMTDIQAAIALTQLLKIEKINNQRVLNAKFYNNSFNEISEMVIPTINLNCKHVFNQYSILFNSSEKRAEFMKYMLSKGIQTRIYYDKPMKLFPLYKSKFDSNLNSTALFVAERIVSIPVHHNLTEKEIYYISETVRGFFNE